MTRGTSSEQPATRTKGGARRKGAPLSPLLANLYMRRFILAWKQFGYAKHFQAAIVNYADDFVILCRRQAAQAMQAMREIMQKLKLTVNETKNTAMPSSGRNVQLSGLYHRPLLYAPDGPGLYKLLAVR